MNTAGATVPGSDSDRPLPNFKLFVIALCAVLGCIGFISLGIWQLERRVWKLALIERVTQRVHAAPVSAPGPNAWPSIKGPNAKNLAEYRHVTITGHWLKEGQTLVQAVTDLGSGFWVIAPLQADDGFIVLINRGFIASQQRDTINQLADEFGQTITVVGLLRLSEPNGAFLHNNDSQANRWYSRDVTAIAAARGLNAAAVAPYFIDADAGSDTARDGSPIGGLTVINFRNNHLSYAATWFALALMPATFLGFILRRERRLRSRG